MILIIQSQIINLDLVTTIRMEDEDLRIHFFYAFLDDQDDHYYDSFEFTTEKRMEEAFTKIVKGYEEEKKLVWIKD
jgi:hypothetical protein